MMRLPDFRKSQSMNNEKVLIGIFSQSSGMPNSRHAAKILKDFIVDMDK